MNFEDEPYVRLYTRDTASWLLMSWQAQTVLMHMLRGKFDRAGVFECSGHKASQAVTAVTRLPADVVEPGLAELLKSGTWVEQDGNLVWPKYLSAQNCGRSDKARQRESREKRRTAALSQGVTAGHNWSQSVTPNIAQHKSDPPNPPKRRGAKGSRKRTNGASLCPSDYQPNESVIAYAKKHGVALDRLIESVRDWSASKGEKRLDWHATMRTCIRREADSKAPAQTTIADSVDNSDGFV